MVLYENMARTIEGNPKAEAPNSERNALMKTEGRNHANDERRKRFRFHQPRFSFSGVTRVSRRQASPAEVAFLK